MKIKTITLAAGIALSTWAHSGQMDYQFNSPSFNGAGFGTYQLSIKQMQQQNSTLQTDRALSLSKAQSQQARVRSWYAQ